MMFLLGFLVYAAVGIVIRFVLGYANMNLYLLPSMWMLVYFAVRAAHWDRTHAERRNYGVQKVRRKT